MEDIYVKGLRHNWCSEKVNLTSYFKIYSDTLRKTLKNDKLYFKAILEQMLSNNVTLGNRELARLSQITNISQLRKIDTKENKTKPHEKSYSASTNQNVKTLFLRKGNAISRQIKPLKKRDNYVKESGVISIPSLIDFTDCVNLASTSYDSQNISNKHEVCKNPCMPCQISDGQEITKKMTNTNHKKSHCKTIQVSSNSVHNKGKQKNTGIRHNNDVQRRNRELLLLHETSVRKNKNLERGKNFIISFRIHDPFKYDEGSKAENFIQEILLLDYQTLDCLRDKIICESDYQDIQGDVSEDPDQSIVKMSRDVYKSAMFYIDNTFYVDKRHPDCEDYSTKIKKWGQSHDIKFGSTCDMSIMKVGNLNIRLGYPYLYMHQGGCEHLVIINDARLLVGTDSLHSSDYPMLSALPRYKSKSCMICETSPGCWITAHNSRMLYDFSLMCKACFKMFNYINGKKCGHFKAYHYFQQHTLL